MEKKRVKTRPAERRTRAEKTRLQKGPSGAETAGVCSLTGHWALSGLHVT